MLNYDLEVNGNNLDKVIGQNDAHQKVWMHSRLDKVILVNA